MAWAAAAALVGKAAIGLLVLHVAWIWFVFPVVAAVRRGRKERGSVAFAPPVVRGPLLVGKSDEARRAERNDGAQRSTTYPSLPSAWRPISAPIPVVGALVPFVRDPLGFVQACADALGPVFTLQVAHRHLTFLAAPTAYDAAFFRGGDAISFEKGVMQYTYNVFGIPKKRFLVEHPSLVTRTRAQMSTRVLDRVHITAATDMMAEVRRWVAGQAGGPGADLYAFVETVVFDASSRLLFGHAFTSAPDVRATFRRFNDGFPLAAAGIPHALMRSFSSARAALLKTISERAHGLVVAGADDDDAGACLFASDVGAQTPSESLAKLWASQANSIPTAFWMLAHLHAAGNEVHLERAIAEVDAAWESPEWADHPLGGMADPRVLQRLPFLDACFQEAIRLHIAGFFLRELDADIDLAMPAEEGGGRFRLSKGGVVVVSPFLAHHDPRYYPAPETFDPYRFFGDTDVRTKIPKYAFMPFGGGRYECPGKRLAYWETRLFVAITLRHLSLALDDKATLPGRNYDHNVGVLPPNAACGFRIESVRVPL